MNETKFKNGELAVSEPQRLIKLKGITTSRVQQALKANNPYPARVFFKVEGQSEDIPVFFRIKEGILCPHHKKYFSDLGWRNCCPWYCHGNLGDWIKPKIKKGSYLQVEGHFSLPDSKSIKFKPSLSVNDNYVNFTRPSFTATSYQVLNSQLTQGFNQEVKISAHHE